MAVLLLPVMAAVTSTAVFTVEQSMNNCYGDGPACWFRGTCTRSLTRCASVVSVLRQRRRPMPELELA